MYENHIKAKSKGEQHLQNWTQIIKDVILKTPTHPRQLQEEGSNWEETRNFWKKTEPETTETIEQRERREWQNIKMFLITQKIEALPMHEARHQNANRTREQILNILMNEEPEYELVEYEKKGKKWQIKPKKEDIVLAELKRLEEYPEGDMQKVDIFAERAGEGEKWIRYRIERTQKKQWDRRILQAKLNNLHTDWIAKGEDEAKLQIEKFEDTINKHKKTEQHTNTNTDLKENQTKMDTGARRIGEFWREWEEDREVKTPKNRRMQEPEGEDTQEKTSKKKGICRQM